MPIYGDKSSNRFTNTKYTLTLINNSITINQKSIHSFATEK
jgi:hypothetical protein